MSRWMVLLATALSLAAVTAFAQSTATLDGAVTDGSGAAVPGVNLTLKNMDKGDERVSASTENGYAFTLVPPGRYQLSAVKEGFQTVHVTEIILQVNASVRRDIVLQVGAVAQSILVEAEPLAVNVSTAILGETMESKRIVELPLNGRGFLQVAMLTPGAVPPARGSVPQSLTRRGSSVSVSVSGTREASSSYLFDGVNSKHDYYGAVGIQPTLESIAEVKVLRGYFSTEFDLPAVVNVVTKSGSNSLHGSVFEFLRNDKLDARNTFAVSKPQYRRNQFGFAAGGPAIKEKLFWFGAYEGLILRSLSVGRGVVPEIGMMDGNFSSLLPRRVINDPATYDPVSNRRQPFAGNIIPASRISEFSKRYRQFVPEANYRDGSFNYLGTSGTTQDDTKVDVRLDYARSVADKFFWRLSYFQSPQLLKKIYPYSGNEGPMKSRNSAVGWTHIFGPTLVNEARIGLDRVFLYTFAPEKALASPDWPTELRFKNLNDVKVCNTVASVAVTGYSTFGGPQDCTITGNNNYLMNDNLSYIRGRHSIRTGFDLTRLQQWNQVGRYPGGYLAFTSQFSGDGAADFVLGTPYTANGGIASPPLYYGATWWGVYVNDEFRINKTLSLNFGLRYQYTQPVIEKYDRQAGFDFATGKLLMAGKDIRRGVLTPDRNNFAPRFGFAYAPFGRTDWSVRGSYGIFYDRLPGNERLWTSQYPPLTLTNVLVSDPRVPTIDVGTLWPPFVSTSTAGVGLALLKDRRDPYLQQWTLSIQHSFKGEMFVEAAYVGSHGVKLSRRVDYNDPPAPPAPGDNRPLQQRRPYPQWGYILTDVAETTSNYHGLQTAFRKGFSRGITAFATYTWSRSMDDEAFEGQKWYHMGFSSYSRSYFDLRHRFVGSFSYEPFLGRFRGWKKQVLGGWQTSGIISMATGLPFGITSSIDSSRTLGSIFPARPLRVCDGNLPPSQRTAARWFDTSCFVQPPDRTYGNAGFNFLDVDGVVNSDIAISKNFEFSERLRLQFRAELFNAINNVNLDRPAISLQSRTFGQVTGALEARAIQLGLKMTW